MSSKKECESSFHTLYVQYLKIMIKIFTYRDRICIADHTVLG